MADQIRLILAVTLTGLAVAGLVAGPPEKLARLYGVGGARTSGLSPPGGTTWIRLPALLLPRPDAVPLRPRVLIGLAAGVVAMLFGQGVLPATGWRIWLIGPLIAGVMIIVLGRIESPIARRRRLKMIFDLPHVLELLSVAMGAGLPLRSAVRDVVSVAEGPLADDLEGVLKTIDLGSNDAAAWRDLRDHPALGRVCVDLARSVDSGTMVISTLRRNAGLARRQRRGALEARAKTVGVKSVPSLMLCFAPAFVLVSIIPIVVTAIQNALG